MFGRHFWALAGVILAVCMWATNSFVGRLVHSDISPIALNFWRWAIALGLFAPFAWQGLIDNWLIIQRHVGFLLLQSFLSISLFNFLHYHAAHTTTVVNLNLVNAMMPLVVFGFSSLLLGIVPRRTQYLGLALALLGLVLVVTKGEFESLISVDINPGDGWMLLAVCVWSLYSVLLNKSKFQLPLFTFVLVQVLFGVVLMLPFYLLDLWLNGGFILDKKMGMALVYIGIFPSVLAILLWNHGVAELGPNRASACLYFAPIFAAGLGTLVLGEPLTWYHLAGELLILAGFYLTVLYSPAAPGYARPSISKKGL